MRDFLPQFGRSFVERIRVRSALNPAIWLCAVTTPTCFSAAYAFQDRPVAFYFLLLLGSAPILEAIRTHEYFTKHAPEKLQSEDFQIREKALDLIRRKGSSLVIDASSLEAIANPTVTRLLDQRHEGE